MDPVRTFWRVAAAAAVTVVLAAAVQPAQAARRITLPPVHARVDYQLGGGYTPPSGVTVVTRDMSEKPARGTYGICYVNAFQTQGADARWWLSKHRTLVLRGAGGKPVHDPGWPDEMLLDTSTRAKRVALTAIVGAWFARCAAAGYRAVEPDNLDSWTRSGGRLTLRENALYAAALVARAHALGLAIAQKNDTDMLALHSLTKFDFAVSEECQVYSECSQYQRVYGRHVIEIEYSDNGGLRGFRAACAARGSRISIVYRDRDLVPRGTPGYVYAHC
jgi:hypothetical protein